MTSENNNAPDIYTQVTQKIIADLEKGNLTWRQPWKIEGIKHMSRPLRHNDVPYSGINTVMLWASASERGFTSPYWMTLKQANELNGQVRAGEKSTFVVYSEKIAKEETDEEGNMQQSYTSLLRVYNVFNANQIEGLSENFYNLTAKKVNHNARIKKIEKFFDNTQANIYTGTEACYYPKSDKIEMPPFESFKSNIHFYGTLSHEVTHWTKHPSRLNRDFNQKRFADEGYAMEELVAELGACFLAADLGYEPVLRKEHAAYIQSWLTALKRDKRFIFQAATHAQRAVEFINNLQPVKKDKQPAFSM